MGSRVWATERFDPPEVGAVPVEATGLQFAWYFRYPGPDGKYGRTKAELEDASAGREPAGGLDPSDPASKADIVSVTMYIPVNREVDLPLRAQHAIHSLHTPSTPLNPNA